MLATVDGINNRSSPFGWAIQWLAYHGFCIFSSVAIFDGAWIDAGAVALGCIPVRATMMLCNHVRPPAYHHECATLGYLSGGLAALEHLLIPFVVGVFTPLIVALLGLDMCHCTTIFLSLLLIDLPGSELLFGAREIEQGSLVGATRMVACVVNIMFMAVTLILGFGIGQSSIMPEMANPWSVITESCPSFQTWWFANTVAMLPLELCFFVILGIRLRDMWVPGFAVMATMFLSAALGLYYPDQPAYVTQAIVLFVGSNLGCLAEYMTAMSQLQVTIPVIVIQAPGAGALKAVLANVNAGGGHAATDAWFELLMIGVAFATGQVLASELWGPTLFFRRADGLSRMSMKLSRVGQCSKHGCFFYRKWNAGQKL